MLTYLKRLFPVKELSLKMLTYKKDCCLAGNFSGTEESNPLFFGHSEHGDEQTKTGKHLHELEFPSYPTDVRLCVVDVVKEYLARTKPLRGIITSLL